MSPSTTTTISAESNTCRRSIHHQEREQHGLHSSWCSYSQLQRLCDKHTEERREMHRNKCGASASLSGGKVSRHLHYIQTVSVEQQRAKSASRIDLEIRLNGPLDAGTSRSLSEEKELKYFKTVPQNRSSMVLLPVISHDCIVSYIPSGNWPEPPLFGCCHLCQSSEGRSFSRH